ncbi:hypothetical protein D6833_08080 [Candidatus Parcubacteria bacterium]|nr:MAG: hypothetical protein D6833_08080 [Candidatus Parcubacteria bacterium]
MFIPGRKALFNDMARDLVLTGESRVSAMHVSALEGLPSKFPSGFRGKATRGNGTGEQALSGRTAQKG